MNNNQGDQQNTTQDEQTPVGSSMTDSGMYNTEAADVAMGSQTKPADRGQTEGSPTGEGGQPVPPVQPSGGSIQTPVGSSTPDAGIYSEESGEAAMGSQTKPADRGQTEGGPGTSQ